MHVYVTPCWLRTSINMWLYPCKHCSIFEQKPVLERAAVSLVFTVFSLMFYTQTRLLLVLHKVGKTPEIASDVRAVSTSSSSENLITQQNKLYLTAKGTKNTQWDVCSFLSAVFHNKSCKQTANMQSEWCICSDTFLSLQTCQTFHFLWKIQDFNINTEKQTASSSDMLTVTPTSYHYYTLSQP